MSEITPKFQIDQKVWMYVEDQNKKEPKKVEGIIQLIQFNKNNILYSVLFEGESKPFWVTENVLNS